MVRCLRRRLPGRFSGGRSQRSTSTVRHSSGWSGPVSRRAASGGLAVLGPELGAVFYSFGTFVSSHPTGASENNTREPSGSVVVVGRKRSVGNAIQIPAAHSSLVYESAGGQVQQPLPQNTTGIPADRSRTMNPLPAKFGSLGSASQSNLTLTISASLRIPAGMGTWMKCLWGRGMGHMFSSCHMMRLISLFCSTRKRQGVWTVLACCQASERLCW